MKCSNENGKFKEYNEEFMNSGLRFRCDCRWGLTYKGKLKEYNEEFMNSGLRFRCDCRWGLSCKYNQYHHGGI